jgi:hypothetical protein
MRTTARASLSSAFFSILGLAAVSLPAGCGGGDDGGEPPDAAPLPDAVQACRAELPDPLPPADGDITGTWGYFSKFFSNVQGVSGSQISRSYYLHEYTRDGEQLTVTETLCDIEVDAPEAGTSIRLGPGFVASQPAITRTGSIAAGDFAFALDQTYIARGVELDDIVNDDLPTDPADPRVVDSDGDGDPGVTLLLDGILAGQLFEVQRDHNAPSGVQTSADRVEGLVVWGSDISYLGADPEFLLDLVNQALPDPDPNKHTFELVRLQAGSDCAYVLENRCDLFTGIEGNE